MTEKTVIQFLFMKTKSHAKSDLWLKACASRCPESKGNFPWLQLHPQTAPDPGHLEGPSSPAQKRDNSCFHYCLQLSFFRHRTIHIQRFVSKVGKQFLNMPAKKCHLTRPCREQDSPNPFIYGKDISI